MAIFISISRNVQLNMLNTVLLCCLLASCYINVSTAYNGSFTQQLALTNKMDVIQESANCSDGELTEPAQYCGNSSMRITYPFWIGNSAITNCNRNGVKIWMEDFHLDCDEVSGKVYLKGEISVNSPVDLGVVEIRNDSSLVVDVSGLRNSALNCSTNSPVNSKALRFSTLSLKPYPGPLVMASDNMLLSWGCATGRMYTANLRPGTDQDYDFMDYEDYTGLYLKTSCSILSKDASNRLCNGSTCCTVPFPPLSSTSATRYVWFSSSASLEYSHDKPACDVNASCNSITPPFVSLFNPEFSDVIRDVFRIRLRWAIPWNFTIDSSDYDPNLASRQERQIKSLIRASANYVCDPEHANLTLVDSVPGYICSCNDGYAGDGYINGLGCADVNECTDPSQNDCIPGITTCHNLQGSYMCKCKSWMRTGDGSNNGTGCQVSPAIVKSLAVTAGILGVFLVFGISATLLVIRHKQITRRKHFVQHGGLQLEAHISNQGGMNTRKLFTEKELKIATNNYSNEMMLGSGGFGTVFKGILADGTFIAIKKPHKKSWGAESKKFANEMLILMQVNHKHIVRLLGCCIETAVPLLVYEFVSNGTLAARLSLRTSRSVVDEEDQNSFPSPSLTVGVTKGLYPIKKLVDRSPEGDFTIEDVSLNWEQRLKIARQIAEALAYLHEAISPPIFHRDVKPENILLDDMLNAKVADFGLSRLVMGAHKEEGKEKEFHHQSSRAVQGTLGYIDPEYFQTLQFSDKSDVYSFGVMLVELITGLKVIDHFRDTEFIYLVPFFLHHMEQNTFHSIIDPCLQLKNDETSSDATNELILSSVMGTAKLASLCLNSVGSMRPSMRELAEKLTYIDKAAYSSRRSEQMPCQTILNQSTLSNSNSSPSTSGSQPQSLSDAHNLYKYTGLSSSYSSDSSGHGRGLLLPSPR